VKNIAFDADIRNWDDTKPLVSIIVPVYNAENYLRFCVDSLIGQSYGKLQIILVNDGSTDGSGHICEEYAKKDSRICVIHQENFGIAVAQNTGLDAVNGSYIAFCDNDDILHQRNIEILMSALLETGADMAKGRWTHIGVSALPEIKKYFSQCIDSPTWTEILDPLNAYESVFCKTLRILGGARQEARYFNEANWCRIYKAEVWDGIRFLPGKYAQDIRVAGRLYSKMGKVIDVDAELYFWLQESHSVTHSKRDRAFLHDNVTAAAENFQFALEQGLIPYRNYFGLTTSVRDETSKEHLTRSSSAPVNEQVDADQKLMRLLVGQLRWSDRAKCAMMSTLRRFENKLYDRCVHSLR
jgi:glycosyltransferase involved in cell wall biosynthesis